MFRRFIFATTVFLCSLSHAIVIGQTRLKTSGLTRADREAWHLLLEWPQDCEDAFQKTHDATDNYAGLEFYHLGASQYLVEISCYPGAYQPGSLFVYYDEGKPSSSRLLKLKGFDSQDDQGHLLGYSKVDGLVTFDDKTKVLEIFSKSRGPGDCGLWVKYRFVRGRPIVIEARARECDERRIRPPVDPRRWPRIRLK